MPKSKERGPERPAARRREVAKHGWPVASAEAYPLVERRERDAASRPLGERDVEIAAACATSLSAFFLRHEELFASDEIEPVCESFFDNDDREVRFTLRMERSYLLVSPYNSTLVFFVPIVTF